MAYLPKQFEAFKDQIKLAGENQTLREKRDIILTKLRKNISPDAPGFSSFN